MTGGEDSLFDEPTAYVAAGRALAANRRGEELLRLAARQRSERPDDPLLAALTRQLLSTPVPGFHLPMLADSARNAAYARAIAAAAPGRRVLDIGAGSGLLAMLAARAGAERVYTCEQDPLLAATAREIVAANGLADRVVVLAGNSTLLDRDRDLGGGVDLVISEVFGHDLVGEYVLPALADARLRLCLPGARFVPAAAAVRVALADFAAPGAALDDVEGFDLSLFARHLDRPRLLRSESPRLALRSAPADLFRFDFERPLAWPRRSRVVLHADGGELTGLAQWLRIELGPGETYENMPGRDARHAWQVPFHALPPRAMRPGEAVVVGGWHDSHSLAIWEESRPGAGSEQDRHADDGGPAHG